MIAKRQRLILTLALALAACGGADRPSYDGGLSAIDAGPPDAGTRDSGAAHDAGPADTGAAPDAGLDTTPPWVTSTEPTDDAVDLASGSRMIRIEFSEAMDPSVDALTARIMGSMSGSQITLNVSYGLDGLSADMIANLPAASRVSIDLQALRDLAGNTIEPSSATTDKVLNFRTR